MITVKDIGWIAGFLEGEGYFHSQKNTPYISAAQVQRQPLEKIQSLLGGNIHLYKLGSLTESPCHRWSIGSVRATGIMFMLFDLMSPKRQNQIRAAILKWKSGPGINWKGKVTHCKNGHEFTVENTYRHPKRGTRSCRICNARRGSQRVVTKH